MDGTVQSVCLNQTSCLQFVYIDWLNDHDSERWAETILYLLSLNLIVT